MKATPIRRRRFGGLFWRMALSYLVVTIIATLITIPASRYEGPFGFLRDSGLVRLFNHSFDNQTNGTFLIVAVSLARAMALRSASGVHCRSRQSSSRSSNSASRSQSMVWTVSPRPSLSRMPTMRSPGTGEQHSPKWMLTPGVSPPPRT